MRKAQDPVRMLHHTQDLHSYSSSLLRFLSEKPCLPLSIEGTNNRCKKFLLRLKKHIHPCVTVKDIQRTSAREIL